MLAAIAVSPQRVPDEMRFSTRWYHYGTPLFTEPPTGEGIVSGATIRMVAILF
jgi:hypothetical protein